MCIRDRIMTCHHCYYKPYELLLCSNVAPGLERNRSCGAEKWLFQAFRGKESKRELFKMSYTGLGSHECGAQHDSQDQPPGLRLEISVPCRLECHPTYLS